MAVPNLLVWVDIETTGLSYQTDRVIEVGVVLTDNDLNLLDNGVSWPVYCPRYLLKPGTRPYDMHVESGLWDETMDAEDPDRVDEHLLAYIESVQFARGIQAHTLPMCGSTIGFDRRFLSTWMPMFEDWFHYRNIDVSSVKELFARWYPEAGEPPKNKAHRAVPDCLESINELRWYRNYIDRNVDRNVRTESDDSRTSPLVGRPA